MKAKPLKGNDFLEEPGFETGEPMSEADCVPPPTFEIGDRVTEADGISYTPRIVVAVMRGDGGGGDLVYTKREDGTISILQVFEAMDLKIFIPKPKKVLPVHPGYKDTANSSVEDFKWKGDDLMSHYSSDKYTTYSAPIRQLCPCCKHKAYLSGCGPNLCMDKDTSGRSVSYGETYGDKWPEEDAKEWERLKKVEKENEK